MYYCYYKTPFGKLLLTGNRMLESVHFPLNGKKKKPGLDFVYSEKIFLQTLNQFESYFKGELTSFEVEFNISGTSFQKKVWQELEKIEYGETTSYGEIAKRIGNPKAARAVGMANNKNPIPIIIPCHRVIGKDGSLTGFGGGLEIKQYLLELEKKMNKRIEPRIISHENASVEFIPGDGKMFYQFKLRDFSSKGFGIIVKKDSKVLKLIKVGDILDIKYHSEEATSSPVSHKTQIKHISEPDPGTYKDHMLVGLLILE